MPAPVVPGRRAGANPEFSKPHDAAWICGVARRCALRSDEEDSGAGPRLLLQLRKHVPPVGIEPQRLDPAHRRELQRAVEMRE